MNGISYTDFIKSKIISEAIHNLYNSKDKLSCGAVLMAKAYAYKKHPEHKDHPSSVQFMWQEDGIMVTYDYEVSGFGFVDGPEKRSEYFKFTYKEVFGWELHPEKSISATWARDYLKNLVDNMFPSLAVNYDI
jgi:hypothetical protein